MRNGPKTCRALRSSSRPEGRGRELADMSTGRPWRDRERRRVESNHITRLTTRLLPLISIMLAFTLAGSGWGDPAHAGQTEVHAPSETTQDGGLFTSQGDNVHISRSLPRAASGHGWWTIDLQAGVRPTHAVVTVQLQIKRTDGVWVNVGEPGSERVKPVGGSANRSNARVVCADRKKRMWRSVVDVDIIGYADSPNQKITPEQPVACRVRSIP
jgi:hypothetical protein